MFRKGGSVAYGTGITSGLEERKNYQFGGMNEDGVIIGEIGGIGPGGIVEELITDPTRKLTQEEVEKIALSQLEKEANQQKEQTTRPTEDMMSEAIKKAALEDIEPTTGEKIGRTLTGLAAAGRTDDPTKFKSIGQFLSEFGTTVAGLEEKDKAAVKKFKLDTALERIKNLSQDEKTALFRNIDELMKRDPDLSYEEALAIATGQNRGSAYLKTDSPQVAIAKIAENYERDYGPYGSRNIGAFIYGIRQGTISDKIASKLDQSNPYIEANVIVDGKPGPEFKEKDFIEDRYYFNPYDNTVYHYQGGGVFKPVPMQ